MFGNWGKEFRLSGSTLGNWLMKFPKHCFGAMHCAASGDIKAECLRAPVALGYLYVC